MGVYEELKDVLGEREEEGLSTMALTSLPANVRRVVQLMLRHRGEMAYPELVAEMESQPEDKRLSQAEVDEILDAMSRLGLMTQTEQKKTVYFKVNLGTATTGTRTQSGPGSERATEARQRADNVWDTMTADKTEAPDKGGLLKRLLGKSDKR